MFGLKVAQRLPILGPVKRYPRSPSDQLPASPKHQEHKGWSCLSCTLDYMKCKTLGEKGRGGGRPLKGNGKKKSHLQEDPADSSVANKWDKWICLETLWCRKSAGLLSAALQCVFNPNAACITEHMFSTQELKQKRLFVIIHSFVYMGSPHPTFCPSLSQ